VVVLPLPLSLRDIEELLAERGVTVTRHWLRRAVDKHGVVLDILVQQRRDQTRR
jgi:transposase-like protein